MYSSIFLKKKKKQSCLYWTTNSFQKWTTKIVHFFFFTDMAKRGKYGQSSVEDLKHDIRAYKNKMYGLNQCQKVYSVPKVTIKRHYESKNKYIR
jgi:hypothetical protein